VVSYRIELEGERAEEHPRRYTRIRGSHLMSGEGITQESLERAVTLSHKKYCSVGATLNSEIESEAILN
jgi:putative redox protein